MTKWTITVAEAIGGLFVYAKTAIAATEKGKAMRLIDADYAKEAGTYIPWCDYRQVQSAIDECPTIDTAPVRHGRWIHTDYALHWTAKDECSECTYHACDRNDLSEYNYCPNCGVKMDGERK